MDKKDIIDFFNRHALKWDAELIRDDGIISKILDNAGVKAGCKVLDVACGTGVLIGDYLSRGAASVTGIDISPEMIRIACGKFSDSRVKFICGDAEQTKFETSFDCIVIYNAFPHFPKPERLIRILSEKLERGGSLTVAHGMSREEIDHHHKKSAGKVSLELMSADDLTEIFSRYLNVTVKISDDTMYQVTGIKV